MHNLFKALLVLLAILLLPPQPDALAKYGFKPAHPLGLVLVSSVLGLAALIVRVTIYTRRLKWLANRPRIGRVISAGCLGILAAILLDVVSGAIDLRTNLALNTALFPIGFAAIEAAYLALRWRKQSRTK